MIFTTYIMNCTFSLDQCIVITVVRYSSQPWMAVSVEVIRLLLFLSWNARTEILWIDVLKIICNYAQEGITVEIIKFHLVQFALLLLWMGNLLLVLIAISLSILSHSVLRYVTKVLLTMFIFSKFTLSDCSPCCLLNNLWLYCLIDCCDSSYLLL
jgi:hypothetical protein